MDRTQFLKAFALTLGGSALLQQKAVAQVLAADPSKASVGARFRPGPGGQILVATGASEGWSVHAGFGPDFEVLRVSQDSEGICADVRHLGNAAFRLWLDPNAQTWKVR